MCVRGDACAAQHAALDSTRMLLPARAQRKSESRVEGTYVEAPAVPRRLQEASQHLTQWAIPQCLLHTLCSSTDTAGVQTLRQDLYLAQAQVARC